MKLRDGPPIGVNPVLDLSSVKTPNPRNMPLKPKERPFGLTDCPTFRPTPEQFKDPMAYVRSISENAKSYGMCKIIPPLGWAMPFVTDTEVSVLLSSRKDHPMRFSLTQRLLDVPFQDTTSTAELHRGILACQSQFPRAALPVSQATGKPTGVCPDYQSQAVGSMVAS